MNLAQEIRNACTNAWDVRFRASYSGRGMYGRHCVGIVGSHSDCMGIISYVIKTLNEDIINLKDEAHRLQTDEAEMKFHEAKEQFDEFVEILLNFNQDNMGRHDYIFYWPNLQAEEGVEDTDEEDVY